MGTFEILVWMGMISLCVLLGVGGVAAIIVMAIEAWAADARRVRLWLRAFFAARKEAST